MKRTLGLVLVCGLLIGALSSCTPKPNEQQLQQLDRTCAAADDAERALESAQRRLGSTERTLAQKRRTLEERQNYLGQVRTNVERSAGQQPSAGAE